MGGKGFSPTKLRPYAILALAGIAAVYLWMLVDIFHWWGAPLWPNENTQLVTWSIFVLLTLLTQLTPPLGLWLLFDIRRRGAGRLWWRGWLGGVIVAEFLSYLPALAVDSARNVALWGAHPFLGSLLALATIPPLWVATSPREAD